MIKRLKTKWIIYFWKKKKTIFYDENELANERQYGLNWFKF